LNHFKPKHHPKNRENATEVDPARPSCLCCCKPDPWLLRVAVVVHGKKLAQEAGAQHPGLLVAGEIVRLEGADAELQLALGVDLVDVGIGCQLVGLLAKLEAVSELVVAPTWPLDPHYMGGDFAFLLHAIL
jgi:hypothetical protein